MADHARKMIGELVAQIFQVRLEQERAILTSQLSEAQRDSAARGARRSGGYYRTVAKLHGEFIFRTLDQILEELKLAYREARRNDGDFFWSTAEQSLKGLFDPLRISTGNSILHYCKMNGGLDQSMATALTIGYSQYSDNVSYRIQTRINELRLRSQFITMKSPTDRKANNVPDVAVMMWFPSEQDGKEKQDKAKEKYEAIAGAVREASKGLATVNKIDNPALVHKDRISPSVEAWLEKSVLVICDLEGNRPNVFYEFGYARALGTTLIVTQPAGQKTDFHLAQWTIDSYQDLDDLKSKLIPRIQTALATHDLSGSV